MERIDGRKIPPPSLDIPSTSALSSPPSFEPSDSERVLQQSSSSFSDVETSSYEKLFPALVESFKKSLAKKLTRSTKKKGKT